MFLKKKIVCLSVCLTFFENADARDLGLMTLFCSFATGKNESRSDRERQTERQILIEIPGNIKSENKDVVVFCIAFYSVLISKKNVDSKHQFKGIFDARGSY